MAKQVFLSIGVILFIILARAAFSEENNKGGLPAEIERAFEAGMKNFERDKAQTQEALTLELKERLRWAISKWVSEVKKQKDSEIGKTVDQKWELLSKVGPRPHYEYVLRDYEYLENGIDITKTESLVLPYKAEFKVMETLYVERERSPNVSDLRKFLYTVSTPIKISFDSKGDSFTLVNTEKGDTSLKQGWPEQILRKIRLL